MGYPNCYDDDNNNVQQSRCNSFIGSSDRIVFSENGVILFKNPKDSGITAHITRVTFTNLGANPISIDAISLAKIDKHLCKSDAIVTRDLACLNSTDPRCMILYGSNATVRGGFDVAILSLRPYETLGGPIEEAIILPPGTNRIFLFESLTSNGTSTVSATIHWREE